MSRDRHTCNRMQNLGFSPNCSPECVNLLKKKQFVRPFRTDAWSKQRCPRVMMITWRHCDGRPTEVSPKMFSDPDALSKVTIHPFHPLRKLTPRSSSLSVSHIVGGGALGAGSNGQSFITSTILNHSQPFSTTRTDRPCRTLQGYEQFLLMIF